MLKLHSGSKNGIFLDADRDVHLNCQFPYWLSALINKAYAIGGIMKKYPPQKYIKKLFMYDKNSGKLFWRYKKAERLCLDQEAGSNTNKGYLSVMIDGINYFVHRIVWIYEKGFSPENCIDHIDRNKKNNRISNLRHVSLSCNSRNSKVSSNNKTGVKGVSYDKENNKYRSSISFNGNVYNLGRYKHLENAVLSRLCAEQCLGWEGCDSSSSAFKYSVNNSLIRSI